MLAIYGNIQDLRPRTAAHCNYYHRSHLAQHNTAAAMNSQSLFARIRFLAIAGVGLFSDGYLNQTIGLVVPMLGYLYFADEKGKVPAVSQDIMKGSLPLGMIVGQLFFGLFGDALGRHRVYGKELILTILGTLLVICMPPSNFSHQSVVAWVACFRVLTGFGTGGGKPSSTACTKMPGKRLT